MYFRCSAGRPIRCSRRSCSAWLAQRPARLDARNDRVRLAEGGDASIRAEIVTAHAGEAVGDVGRDVPVDVADEAGVT
jgi:hypothetical protein